MKGKTLSKICSIVSLMLVLGLAIPVVVEARPIYEYQLVQRKYSFLVTAVEDEWGDVLVTSWADITISTWNAINQWYFGEHPDELIIMGTMEKYGAGPVNLKIQVDNPYVYGDARWELVDFWIYDYSSPIWGNISPNPYWSWEVEVNLFTGFPSSGLPAIDFILLFHPTTGYDIPNDYYEVFFRLTYFGPSGYDEDAVFIYAK